MLFPRKLTWNLKNEGNPKKTSHLPGVKIFRFYVSLWGCTWFFRSGFLFRVGFFRVERLDSLGNLMVLKVTRIHEQKFRPEIPQEMKSLNEQLAKEGRTRLPEYVFFCCWIRMDFCSLDVSHKTQVVEAVEVVGCFLSQFLTTSSERGLCLFHELKAPVWSLDPSLEKLTASLHLKIGRNLKKHDNFQPSIFRSENVSFRELYLNLLAWFRDVWLT